MSAQEICILAAFLAAGFVHGVAGFGAGIVAMSIIPAAFTMLDAVRALGVRLPVRRHRAHPGLRAETRFFRVVVDPDSAQTTDTDTVQ